MQWQTKESTKGSANFDIFSLLSVPPSWVSAFRISKIWNLFFNKGGRHGGGIPQETRPIVHVYSSGKAKLHQNTVLKSLSSNM